MVDTTPNNSYYVRVMLLNESWEEISIGENNGLEKMISLPGVYYVWYAWSKSAANTSKEGCELD